ncbi:Uncharacterised protein [Mycobacteroides abscessus subsp. abscessus]|nr:Uncharacterised protein [Mycobacteroides abscessus subsp. abscessus]
MAGALRGDHGNGDVGRRLDQTEVDVQAVSEEQRIAVLEVRLDLVLEDLGLRSVGREDHDDVGPLGDLFGGIDLQPLLGDLLARLGALTQADLHLNAGVAQAQRVRVPLAAVPDNADLASLNEGQVRIVVVEHLNCHLLDSLRLFSSVLLF